MKPVLALCMFVALSAAASETLPLKADWRLQSSAVCADPGASIGAVGYQPMDWYAISVPSTVLAALVENKVYPDPFFGDNITKIPGYKPESWLVMAQDSPFYPSWWYRTEFAVPASYKGKNLVLHLDGLNFRANVWLNGVQIANDQDVVGMFRRYEFDVTGGLVPGAKNCLAVEVTAAGHVEDKNYRSKQIEATTGWDDHNPQPPDLNMGLWQDVYITATGPIALRHPFVHSKLDLPGLEAAHLTVSAYAVNKTNEAVTGLVAGVIENIRFEQEVTLAAGEKRLVTFTPEAFPQLNIQNPRVWWPNNLGPQELYDCSIECKSGGAVSDAVQTRFGIRDATTYINDEGWRQYMINGQKVLIRGGAWMTCDMLLRFDARRYEALVRYAKEANLNMLRSEGFSIRETETFYNFCDQYGIMVTQQLFGRTIPDEDLAISCIEDTLLRIRNHPSLVHFLGHDETFPSDNLDAAYQRMIADYTPGRTYQPHSGAFEVFLRRKTGGTRTGSLETWQYVRPVHYYISKSTGAWGFAQSGGIGGVFASLESMKRMLPEDALWPVWTDAWSLHTVTQGGNYFNRLVRDIDKRYGEAKDIEDFLRKGFALNYDCARGMFEAYGRNKYSATGLTTWKYDAAWPASPTWQYVDWYLIATGAYYGAKKACEPLHVQYSYDDRSIWAVNNYYRDHKGLKVTATLYDFDMTERWTQTAAVDIDSNGNVPVFDVPSPENLTTAYFLYLTLDDADGKRVTDNFYALSTAPEFMRIMGLAFTRFAPGADFTSLQDLPPAE
ncbi:MAG: exo,4-beta-D-glucosaminidase, partial [Candidatus Hydrogenedentes bacterium]|nr:exo,4-beta-D-glucosaminidase [Candidatus Hydrogenedentota bacterium]